MFFANNLTEKSASSMLTVLAQTALDAIGIEIGAIDAFAVGKGPGSYTGLRVATSVAKGFCFALDKPLIGVNTLEAMAFQVRKSLQFAGTLAATENVLFMPMIDARRMEVYCAVYDKDGQTIAETTPLILEASSLDPWLENSKVVLFGDGAAKCKPLFEHLPNVIFWGADIHPQAAAVGALACQEFLKGNVDDPALFEPLYLKEFMMKQKA